MNSLVDAVEDTSLPEHVRKHLPRAQEAAQANAARARQSGQSGLATAQGLLKSAARPGVAKASRVLMLRQAAAEWSQAHAPYSACRRGCSHCCHVAVAVPRTEAQLIAKKTGARLRQPAFTRSLWDEPTQAELDVAGTPCVFLENGRCSIYEHRPFVCRTLLNMDDVELLCELHPGQQVPVPYADARVLQGAFGLALQDDPVADIREWFAAQ